MDYKDDMIILLLLIAGLLLVTYIMFGIVIITTGLFVGFDNLNQPFDTMWVLFLPAIPMAIAMKIYAHWSDRKNNEMVY